jgi:hypothetical protein
MPVFLFAVTAPAKAACHLLPLLSSCPHEIDEFLLASSPPQRTAVVNMSHVVTLAVPRHDSPACWRQILKKSKHHLDASAQLTNFRFQPISFVVCRPRRPRRVPAQRIESIGTCGLFLCDSSSHRCIISSRAAKSR